MRQATTRPIKDYCLGIYDGPHATPKESDEGPIFLGIKNITDDGRLDFSEVRNVSEEDFPKWTRRVTPEANDVVFTYEATLHRYAIIPEGFRGCLGRRVALLRLDPDQVDSRYLLYFFLSEGWRRVVESNIITGATVDRVPIEKFPDFPVILPKLSVQREIASILSPYDDLIENNRRRMELLEEAARQLYREWFVRLRFPGREHTRIINGVPEGWGKGRVADLGEIITGKTPSTNDESNYGDDIQFVKTPDMHRQIIVVQTEQSLSEKGAASQSTKFVPDGSILVACIGAKLGVVSLTSERCQTNQQINAVIPHDTSLRYYSFFALCDLKPMLQAMGGGATMPNVNKTKFSELPLLLPRHSLLAAFTDLLDPIFLQIRTLLLLNKNLKLARDLFLPRLVSGEIAV